METTAQPAASDPLAGQLQEHITKLGMLTIAVAQAREERAERKRQAESLTAELIQRDARIEQDEQELLRLQGAVAALQQLQQAQKQEAGNG